MWIEDLEKATQKVKNKLKYCCINRVAPCVDGIVFETTANTNIKYFYKTEEVVEYDRDSWRKG